MRRQILQTIAVSSVITSCFADPRAEEHTPRSHEDVKASLAEQGIGIDFVWTGEYFYNVDGGIRKGGEYRGDLSLTIELDTETAGWWDDGTIFAHFQAQHGDGITEDYVGDFQVLSNIDADDYVQVAEFWYEHRFLDDRLRIKIGKQESNADFAFVDYGAEFLNSSPGFPPTIPLVTYPDPDWGIMAGWSPNDHFQIDAGVYQGDPNGGRSIANTIENLRGPLILIQPAFHYEIANHPGVLRSGVWWHGGAFDRLGIGEDDAGIDAINGLDLWRAAIATNLPTAFAGAYASFLGEYVGAAAAEHILRPDTDKDETSGVYILWEQEVYRENPNDKDDAQGIGIFAQWAFADKDVLEAKEYAGFGLQWTGLIPSRDADILGVGVFHTEFSERLGLEKPSETAFELFYRAQLTSSFSIKPDMQYIVHPGGSGADDALALGIRWEWAF